MNVHRRAASLVYRSERGREEVLAAYRAQAARVPFAFESRFVPTAFGTTHVLLAGAERRPPLVVLSGVNFGAFFTSEWVGELATQFRLIIPDVVGQPNLSAETRPRPTEHEYGHWLTDVLNHLVLERTRVMGISFGGALALDFAAYAPARVIKAALLVPGGFSGGSVLSVLWRIFLPWSIYRFSPRPERIPKLVSSLGDNLPEHWLDFFDLLFRQVRWAVRPPGPFAAADFAGYTAPTLAVFARRDCFFPGERAAQAAAQALGRTVATRVVDGKHIQPADSMALIQRSILDFLR